LIQTALDAIREHLDMDVTVIGEPMGEGQVHRYATGDANAFGLEPGDGLALDGSHHPRILDERLPDVIPDARLESGVGDLPVTGSASIGPYVGVPLELPGGRLFGMLCCLSREPRPSLSTRDVGFVRVLAQIIAQELDRRHVASEHRRGAVERVRRVLDGDELAMVFQPIVDLRSGEAVGFEALARFAATPRRSPDAWFREAAEVGLGPALELAAVDAALRHLDDLPPHAYLSLNVSPEIASTSDFVEAVGAAPAGRLAIELTEHTRVADYGALRDALAGLRQQGARLIVDDAGAGFASLRHILRLAPDAIKLDRTLTTGIDADPARRALTTALVAFATDIRATIIAEGVASRGELETLRDLGVQHGQGYYLGRPLPLAPSLTARPDAVGYSSSQSPAATALSQRVP
jgi:EAL domain-containing protein (putative c-di-GMP-specific phosphodiesterase class I)